MTVFQKIFTKNSRKHLTKSRKYSIIYIVMCPKNGTIFMLRVPWMGLFIFCIIYVYIGNDIDLVESTHGGVFFICMVEILQRVIFIF